LRRLGKPALGLLQLALCACAPEREGDGGQRLRHRDRAGEAREEAGGGGGLEQQQVILLFQLDLNTTRSFLVKSFALLSMQLVKMLLLVV
jgi:hypothetical protein